MGTEYLKGALAPPTQREAAPGTVENSAGGQSFKVDPWNRLTRFLILGSEGGSYYAGERKLTAENVQNLRDLLDEDGLRFVAAVVTVSQEGRAPKNDPALLALALAASAKDQRTREQALLALPLVARTGTHLFTFLEFVDQLRGWGRALRRAVAAWYTSKDDDVLGYQLVKYRQRNGWTHADALRLAHPKAQTPTQQQLLSFAAGKGYTVTDDAPDIQKHVALYMTLQKLDDPRAVAKLIEQADGAVAREMLKTEHAGNADVQRALLNAGIPLTALIRNLGNLTRLGILAPGESGVGIVLDALQDEDRIRKARVHPMQVLIALTTYANSGAPIDYFYGRPQGKTWDPNPRIVDALNDAFYLAFGNVEPTGKRVMLALDVSGSMASGNVAGSPLSPREASAAMALVTAAREQDYSVYGFTSKRNGWSLSSDADGFVPLNITPRQRLDDAIRAVSGLPFGGTDCALPMQVAHSKGLKVDTFIVYTDSETWAGSMHPDEALRQYRRSSGIDAKLIVVGMVANEFSIANPNDPGMLDVVGFDTATPNIISEFSRGAF